MTIIRDSILEPYFIQRDQHNYTVCELVTPTRKHHSKDKMGQNYEKLLSFCGSFASALKYIAKRKLDNNKPEYNSIQDYVSNWQKITDQIEKKFNIKSL
tara:strand:- start:499 stop:795 length:297 start_codon:yes stop_codon:yes gene_type:complete